MQPNDHQTNWQKTLDHLQLRMTRNTYDAWLKQTAAISATNGHYRIAVASDRAADWLQHRLHNLVKTTLQQVDPAAEKIEFVVTSMPATSDRPVTTPPLVTSMPATPDRPVTKTPPDNNYPDLWRRTGYIQLPHYINRFWRAYLGRSFDLWQFIQAHPITAAQASLDWTPPRKFYYRQLARALRASTNTVKGGLENCYHLRMATDLHQPFKQCCLRCPNSRWKSGPDSPRCLHWRTGLLETLYSEGLLAIKETTSERPRAHSLQLQVWRNLPLLTPRQTQHLSQTDQLRHDTWMDRYSHLTPIPYESWCGIRTKSLITPDPDSNRSLHDPYQPNPLKGA